MPVRQRCTLLYAQSRLGTITINDDAAGVSHSGTWTTGTNAVAYGGTYHYSTEAGATIRCTCAATTTAVGIRSFKATNGGIGVAYIDNDTTLCTLLPTAQSLVDAGTLANTVLVANGGTLNPTDRIYDAYAAALTDACAVCREHDRIGPRR